MYEMAKARPGHYKFWLETVVSDADKARFVKGCLSVFLTAPVVLDESGAEDYCSFGGVLKSIRVKDRAGAQWLVDLEERDVQICGPPGASAFYNCVRLFNFRRLDSKGNRILSAVAPKSLVESKMDI